MTLAKVLGYIYRHPSKNRVVGELSLRDISCMVTSSLERGGLAVIEDAKENICGVCVGIPSPEDCTLHISILICDGSGTLKMLLEFYKQHFTGYTIQAYRYGDFTKYPNTDRLVSLLSNLTK